MPPRCSNCSPDFTALGLIYPINAFLPPAPGVLPVQSSCQPRKHPAARGEKELGFCTRRMEHPVPDSVVAFSTTNTGFWILGSEGKLCSARDSPGGSGVAEVAQFHLAARRKAGMLCWLPKISPSRWGFRAADVKNGFFHLGSREALVSISGDRCAG